MHYQLIAKEDIPHLLLIRAEDPKLIHFREVLKYFERLGNEYKGKCKIIFNTSDGAKAVETTVWSVFDDYCQLKGAQIPLDSIIEVRH